MDYYMSRTVHGISPPGQYIDNVAISPDGNVLALYYGHQVNDVSRSKYYQSDQATFICACCQYWLSIYSKILMIIKFFIATYLYQCYIGQLMANDSQS